MIVWTAGHNMPGYLPESEPVAFETRKDALDYTCDEMRRAADHLADVVSVADLEYRHVQEYEEAADSLAGRDADDVDGDWYDTFEDGRIAYWITAQDVTDDEAAAELLNGEGY